MILGYPVLGIYYWCADQTIVQRVLGARSMKDAQVGPVFAGFIKILPVFLMVFPGVLAYVLFQDKIADSNDTLLVLITELLPVRMKGIMAAALMAALMSTIAAALNSTGTLVSIAIIMAMISPPVSTVFLLGAITFCFDFVPISGFAYISEGLGMHFMMQAWWLFVICSIIFITVSLLTTKPESSQLENLTLSLELQRTKIPLAGWLSLLLLTCMVCLYLIVNS